MINSEYKEKLRRYLYVNNLLNWESITLTMKQRVNDEKLDKIKSYLNFKYFMNRLNTKIYGNSFKRYGKRIEVIPVLENSRDNRLHYHILIKRPERISSIRFKFMIKEEWNKTKFGYEEVCFNEETNNGWVNYITKSRGEDKVDWESFYRV